MLVHIDQQAKFMMTSDPNFTLTTLKKELGSSVCVGRVGGVT